jgi:hypothetical protein
MKDAYCKIPEGLELPEEAMKGESIDLVASGKVVDGSFIIEALDGVPLSSAPEDSEDSDDGAESKPPTKKKRAGFMESIEAQLGGTSSS